MSAIYATFCNVQFLLHLTIFPFGPFWSVKYFNFEQKLSIWTAHHAVIESKHPEVTKNLYVLLKTGAKKWHQLINYMQ